MATTSSTTSASSSLMSSNLTQGGINVDAVVSGLMSIERQPINQINSRISSYKAKITALGTLKGQVSTFQTAVKSLTNTSSSSLQAFTATSADTSIVTATANSSAVAGVYALSVTNLAQSQKLVSAGQTSSTAAIGTGASTDLTFDFGTISGGTLTNGVYSGASFAPNGNGTKTITITNSNNTLQGIRDAINAAGMGVTASIVNDGSGTPYRLALSSNNTGINNSIKISASGTGGGAADAAITNLMAYDPAGTQRLSETVTANNANFTVNGISVTKASNTVTDVIEGVSLTLTKSGSTSLTVARDTSATTTAVNNFVSAYNTLYSAIKNSYDRNSGSALSTDPTLRDLQSQMRGILTTAATGGNFSTLNDIGISAKSDGSLQVDSTKLSNAINNNFSDLSALFSSSSGFATRFDTWSTSTLAYNGAFASRTDNLNKTVTALTKQTDSMEIRMTNIENAYRRQFSTLNATLIGLNQTSSYLAQQLAKL